MVNRAGLPNTSRQISTDIVYKDAAIRPISPILAPDRSCDISFAFNAATVLAGLAAAENEPINLYSAGSFHFKH